MRAPIRRLAAAALMAVVCLAIISVWGPWEAGAAGHEHVHAESGGEWTALLGGLNRLAMIGAIMALGGILLFRSAVWSPASGGEPSPAIGRIEQIAAVVLLYALVFGTLDNALAVAQSLVAVVWLLAAWGMIPSEVWSQRVKALCALAFVGMLLEPVAADLSIAGVYAIVGTALYVAAGAVWGGGGLALYLSLIRKPQMPIDQAGLLLARYMPWAGAAGGAMLLSAAIGLATGLGTGGTVGLQEALLLIRLLLSVGIMWLTFAAYRRWKQSDEEESRLRFRLNQSWRFALSLIVLVLALGAFQTTPGKGVLGEPVYWHVMGEEAHMSLRIRDSGGDRQQVRLDVWLPSGKGRPAGVEVKLQSGELTAQVPLGFKEGGPDPYGFEGFDKYTYEAEGRYVTAVGAWQLNVVVTDPSGRRFEYEKTETVPVESPL